MKINTVGQEKGYALLLVLLVGSVVVLGLYWYVVSHAYPEPAERGQFGDMFGGVNALFTAFAFASLIYTVILQRRELGLQRDELELTRVALAGQREQLQRQNETFIAQSFENTFFQLLALNYEILRGMRLTSGNTHAGVPNFLDGRQVIQAFEEALRAEYSLQFRTTAAQHIDENLVIVFTAVFPRFENEIGHYLRNTERVLVLLERCEGDRTNEYAGFLRAQLSSSELFLIFYACLSGESIASMKPLVEKHCLLKEVVRQRLLDPAHQEQFDQKAFYRVGVP